MSALTAAVARRFEGEQEETEALVAASDIYYKGGVLVGQIGGGGYAEVPSDTAAQVALGIISGIWSDGDRVDAKTVAASSHPGVILRCGKVWLPLASVAQTDCFKLAYLLDDGTLTLTAGSKTVGYQIKKVDATNALALVDLRKPDRIA